MNISNKIQLNENILPNITNIIFFENVGLNDKNYSEITKITNMLDLLPTEKIEIMSNTMLISSNVKPFCRI